MFFILGTSFFFLISSLSVHFFLSFFYFFFFFFFFFFYFSSQYIFLTISLVPQSYCLAIKLLFFLILLLPPPSFPPHTHIHTYIVVPHRYREQEAQIPWGKNASITISFLYFFSTMQQIIRVSMIVPPIAKKDSPSPNICKESPSSPLINSLAHVCFPSSLSQHLCCFFVVKNPEQM